jgi:hypothetical protein
MSPILATLHSLVKKGILMNVQKSPPPMHQKKVSLFLPTLQRQGILGYPSIKIVKISVEERLL